MTENKSPGKKENETIDRIGILINSKISDLSENTESPIPNLASTAEIPTEMTTNTELFKHYSEYNRYTILELITTRGTVRFNVPKHLRPKEKSNVEIDHDAYNRVGSFFLNLLQIANHRSYFAVADLLETFNIEIIPTEQNTNEEQKTNSQSLN